MRVLRNIRNIFTRAELTDQEVRTLRGIIVGLTGEIDGDDRGVGQPATDADLIHKAVTKSTMYGQVFVHHLDGDGTPRELIRRVIDRRGRAFADQRADDKSLIYRRAGGIGRLGTQEGSWDSG